MTFSPEQLTIGGFVTVGGILAVVWTRLESTFVRKDIYIKDQEHFRELMARVESTLNETKAIVTEKMPQAIQEACLAGVREGRRERTGDRRLTPRLSIRRKEP